MDVLKNAIIYAKCVIENEIDFTNPLLLVDTIKVLEPILIKKWDPAIDNEDKFNKEHIFTEPIHDSKNINNFNLFLSECCDICEDAFVSYSDLKDQYKIWAKTPSKYQLTNLINFTKDKYTNESKPNKLITYQTIMKHCNPLVSTSSKTLHFIGIKLKACLFNFEQPLDDTLIFEKFLFEHCKRSPGYRVIMTDLFDEFETFYKSIDNENNYTEELAYIIKEKIKVYFDSMFLRNRIGNAGAEVNNQDLRALGWLGLALKSNNIPQPITKYTPKNRKPVNQIGMISKEIITTFDSVTSVANYLDKSKTVTTTIIKRHEPIIIDDVYYVFDYKK